MKTDFTQSPLRNHLTRWIFVLLACVYCGASLAADAVWIDVRTVEEYQEEHIPQAVNIPYDEIEAGVSAMDLKSDQTIYLYCGSGRRAGLALETLESLGYTEVKNLGGLEDAEEFAAEQSSP